MLAGESINETRIKLNSYQMSIKNYIYSTSVVTSTDQLEPNKEVSKNSCLDWVINIISTTTNSIQSITFEFHFGDL